MVWWERESLMFAKYLSQVMIARRNPRKIRKDRRNYGRRAQGWNSRSKTIIVACYTPANDCALCPVNVGIVQSKPGET